MAAKNCDPMEAVTAAMTENTAVLKALLAQPNSAARGATAADAPVPATPRNPDRSLLQEYGFGTPREFMATVMKAYTTPGLALDKRLAPLSLSNIRKAARDAGDLTVLKAAGSDENAGITDPFGGFLVPVSYSSEFLKIAPEVDPAAGKTRNVPMGNPIVKIPARTDKNHTTSVAGGVTFTRKPETVGGTASRIQVEQVTLEAHTLFGLSFATEELLMDSPQTFSAILADGFAEQYGYHMANERLNGTGVGEFLGVWNALDSNGTGPTLSVSKETGQAAATIVVENLYKMRAQAWHYSDAIWIANHDTIPQLMLLNQPVGLGGAVVWQPSAREDHPDMLLGRPIFFSEYAQTLGTIGDIGIYNWKEYLEGTLQPMQNDMSIHVRFVNHERTFKFFTRNAGCPWWRTALTPKNSANKLSPFVLLATRS